MRGTGCSGGAFDFFEPLQSLDGYDVIETVARQPWVAAPQGRDDGHLLRRDQPAVHRPDAAAEPRRDHAALGDRQHADDALSGRHPQHRLRARLGQGARPRRQAGRSPTSGQPWAYQRIQEGDQTCKANQDLHPEAVDLIGEDPRQRPLRARRSPTRCRRSRSSTRSTCPVFMACQWTDEQTGGHCPTLAAHFTGTDRKWFTFTNGTHVDSLDPETFNRWYDFLELYVARAGADHQLGADPGRRAGDLPGGRWAITGRDAAARPDPACSRPTPRRSAAFEALPPIRVLFDNGAGGSQPGQPVPGLRALVPALPGPGHHRPLLVPRRATARSPTAARERRRRTRSPGTPHARPLTDFTGDTGAGDGRPVDRDAALPVDARTRPAARVVLRDRAR